MITVIGSLKGGSGKSTITFNLAIWLAMAEVDVAVVDADPQATLTDALEVRREEGFKPMVDRLPATALDDRRALAKRGEVLVDVGTASMDNLRLAISLADRLLVPARGRAGRRRLDGEPDRCGLRRRAAAAPPGPHHRVRGRAAAPGRRGRWC